MAPVDDEEEEDEVSEGEQQQLEQHPEQRPGDLPECEADAAGWQNLLDSKIRKRTLREGSGNKPKLQEDARCSFKVCLSSSDGVQGPKQEVLQCHRDVRYRIGEGEAIPMLELGLRYMREGEEAELFGVPSMAWGAEGLQAASLEEKAVPPNASISLQVHLHEVTDPHGGEQPSPWNELIQAVVWRKNNGNEHFRRQTFFKAVNCYKAGLEVFDNRGFEPPESVKAKDRPAAKAAAMSMVTDCGANLAAVYLELGQAAKAKAAAKTALEMCPEHLKCLFRAARACLILDDFEECEELLRRGLAKEPDNAALQRVEAELLQKQRRYEAKSKRVAGRLFKDLGYPDLVAERAARQRAWAEEETWGFWFRNEVLPWFSLSRQVISAALLCSVLLAIGLALLPRRHYPIVLISYALGTPTAIGLTSAVGDLADKEKEDGKNARKKKKKP